jgi:xanthine dehydrogenase YagR molybdenum-binding subunit
MASRKIIKSKYFFEEEIVESLAEVPVEEIKIWDETDEFKFIGKPMQRVDGYDKVSGTAKYTLDITLSHMAYAKTLRCPHSHAKIKNIDTRKAKALKGVIYILTFKNSPRIEWYDTSFLFDTHLRYEGDEVACVAAESERIAEEALKLIEVEYKKLPFVIEAEEAMKSSAPKLYDKGNIVSGEPYLYSRGDLDKGFAEADVIIEDTFQTQVEIHNPTEPHCSVVNWDGDRLTVWDSTQAIFSVRDRIANKLGLPSSKVRVIKKYMGGGFGSKLEAGKYTVMAALISQKIARPVQISLDRREMNLAVGNRPDSTQKIKVGTKKNGVLTALTHYAYGSAGAHPRSAGCSWPLRTIYQCTNVSVEEYSVFINAGRNRPFRAPGHVQGVFALESILDETAEKIGMDPLEFRMINYAEKDQVYDIPYTSKLLKDAYLAGAKAIQWKKNWKPPGSEKGPIQKGLGLASQIWWGGGGPPVYAILKLNRDASVQVLCGTQDIGGGTYTFIAQIAAEVLQIPIDSVQVTLGDTATCPYASSSGGSNTAPSVSPAIRDAAEQMKAKLMSGAVAILELPESELVYHQGIISAKNDEGKKIEIGNIVRKMRERVMITTGARSANPDGYMINSFGVQFAEVEVDTDTGRVKVNKIVAAHDIGRVLNYKLLENQFHGGIIQGLGFALMEERVIDQNTGKVLTTNMHDYKIPTIIDVPEIEVIIVSKGDKLISNTGVKGVGEPPMIPTPGAIANAVYNACGARIKSLPITPDKVLMALNMQ